MLRGTIWFTTKQPPPPHMLDDLCGPAPTPTELTYFILHHMPMLPFIKNRTLKHTHTHLKYKLEIQHSEGKGESKQTMQHN